MATEWKFLEPWRTVLRDSSMRENTHAPESVLDVSFAIPDRHPLAHENNIYLELSRNERSRRNSRRLQQLREAMELFTLLSFVNHEAFQKLLLSPTVIQPFSSLRWTIRLIGNLSSSNADVAQTQVTWGAFLGFPDDPWEYSSEYRAAVQKLEAMGAEESREACSHSKAEIDWTCRFLDSRVEGLIESADVSRSYRDQLRRLFDIRVHLIVRVFASRGCATLVNTCTPANAWRQQVGIGITQSYMAAIIRNLAYPAVPELTLALSRTGSAYLRLDLERATINSRQDMMNAGFFLSTLVCDKALRHVTRNCNDSPHDRILVNFGKLYLWCSGVCNRVFNSICSAVAESDTEVHMTYQPVRSGQWSWLIYALCCGSSNALVPSVEIWQGRVTKSDIMLISAVLQTKYPQPILNSNGKASHSYGFVDIPEGTELYPRAGYGDNDSSFVLSRGCRCRALYNPNDRVSWVNFVVPGYGICKAKHGEGVKFTPDSEKPVFPEKRLCGSLALYNSTFETPAVFMELLTLVTHGLRWIILHGNGTKVAAAVTRIDLCVLSVACPDLQNLSITEFNVFVSVHNESLRRWPIKTITIEDCTGPLSDLTRCLRNPMLRMARQLVKLEVIAQNT